MIQESILDVLRGSLLLTEAAGWKKDTINIRTYRGPESIQAFTKQNLAVHKTGKFWTVTHAPSGMAAAKDIVSKEAAYTIADELAQAFPEFAQADEKQVQQIAKTQGRQIATKIRMLMDLHNNKKPTSKQIEKKAREEEEEKEVKKFFDKINGDKYETLMKQFFIYVENEGLSLDYRYQYHSNKEKEKKQQAVFKAFDALKALKLSIDYAKKGLYTKEHKSKYEKYLKQYKTEMLKLKKQGIDVSSVDFAKKKYLVRYKGSGAIYYGGSADTEGSRKLGDDGPQKDGIYVMASSEKEAKDIAQKQVNLRADLLMAKKV